MVPSNKDSRFYIWIIISISNFQVIGKGGVLFLLGLLLPNVFIYYNFNSNDWNLI